jgi:hypothetical protein
MMIVMKQTPLDLDLGPRHIHPQVPIGGPAQSTNPAAAAAAAAAVVVNVFLSSRDFGLKHSQVAHFFLKSCFSTLDV